MHQSKPHEVQLAEHRAAVRDLARAAGQLDAATWLRPAAADKWSPALITEHITLSIVAFTDDAAGRAHMAVKLTAFRRFLLRTFLLRRVLRTGQFPPQARAPRETVPSPTPRTQRDAIADLEQATRTLEATIAAHADPSRCWLTHPYFGRLPLSTSLRLLTLHARHHLRQFPRRPADA
jgi:hypothetical protein